jgi:hypothetical protein
MRSATGHVFMATPHSGTHRTYSFSIQYTAHYNGLLRTLMLCLKYFYKIVLHNINKSGTMSSHKRGNATASENVAKGPYKCIILEEKWKLLEEWRVGNPVLLFTGI